MKYNKIKLTENDLINLIKESVYKVLNEMPSAKSAIEARNKAIDNLYHEKRVNGDYNEPVLSKKVSQMNTFNNYIFDVLQKAVGTKVQLVIEKGTYNTEFYDGKIVKISKNTPSEFIFEIKAIETYNTNNEIYTKVKVNINIYENNDLVLKGVNENNEACDIKFVNKKIRKAIATLLNYSGDDEYLKKI